MSPSERTISYSVNRAGPGTMRLWTVQPVEVWEALRRERELFVEEALASDLAEYREAYDWLREQMRRRVPGYQGRYPWWAYDYKVDLRSYRYEYSEAGTREVPLELAVPREQVLLSASGAWHYVLTEDYLPYPADDPEYREQGDAWDAELARQGIDPTVRPLPEPYESRLTRSWERIFDVDDLRDTNTIQATFEHLALEQVVSVAEFTTRPRERRR